MGTVVNITERTFNFGVEVILLCNILNHTPSMWQLSKQLIRSGTSIGANVEEAQAAQSRPDFAHKMNVALKEARESHYWLRLIIATNGSSDPKLGILKQEANELMKIIGAIIVSTKKQD